MNVYGENQAEVLAGPHVTGKTRVSNCDSIEDVASDVEAVTSAVNLLPALRERGAHCARAVTLPSGAGTIKVSPSLTTSCCPLAQLPLHRRRQREG